MQVRDRAWGVSLSLNQFEDMLKLPLVSITKCESAVMRQPNIGLVREVLEEGKSPGVGCAGAETLSVTDEGLLILMDNDLGTGVLFQKGGGCTGVVDVGMSDADIPDGVLLVGQDLIDGLEEGIDLHGCARVDQDPVVGNVALDQEGGDWNGDSGGDGPDNGAAVKSRADFNKAVEVREVVHCR